MGTAYAFLGLYRGGIGWDSVRNTSVSIITRSLDPKITLQEAYDIVPGPSEFYGVLVQFLADKLNYLFTGSVNFLQAESSSTYIWQGAVNILLALIASAVLSYAVFTYTGSFIMASGTWALLNTTPIWLGMSHVNFKDMPLAAGLTLVSAGLMILLNEKKIKFSLAPHVIIALGVFTSVGSRPGSIPLVLILIFIGFLAQLILARFEQKRPGFVFLSMTSTLIGLFLAVISLKIINPIARIDLSKWLIDSTRLASEFPHDMPQRIAGKDFSSLDLPWWYMPAWFLAQMPILFSIFFFISAIIFVIRPKKLNLNHNIALVTKVSPVLAQGILLPVAIILSGSIIYDAVRHFLFAWPTFVVLVLLGLKYIFAQIEIKFIMKSTFLSIVILAIITINLFASVRWFPYSYAFINPIAGYSAEKRNWDLDYWGVSAREGIDRLIELDSVKKVYVMPDGSSSIPYKGIGLSVLEELEETEPFGLYVFIRWNHRIVPEKCDIVFEIKRDFQTLGMGGICPKGAGASTG